MGRYDYKYDDTQPPEPINESTIEHSMGEVIIWFEALDDAVSAAIAGILNRGDVIGRVVTTPLSFRLKVEMFSNLFKADRPTSSIAELIDDLCAACLQIEEERNKIVHSKWARAMGGSEMERSKFSTKMKHGLKETKETWAPGKFSSVWAHCGHLAHEIDEWMWAEYGRQYAPDALEDDPPRREPYEREVS
jgi:hypothetical protein